MNLTPVVDKRAVVDEQVTMGDAICWPSLPQNSLTPMPTLVASRE